jgi:hypothetical protein
MTSRTIVRALIIAGVVAVLILGLIVLIYLGILTWLMSLRGGST